MEEVFNTQIRKEPWLAIMERHTSKTFMMIMISCIGFVATLVLLVELIGARDILDAYIKAKENEIENQSALAAVRIESEREAVRQQARMVTSVEKAITEIQSRNNELGAIISTQNATLSDLTIYIGSIEENLNGIRKDVEELKIDGDAREARLKTFEDMISQALRQNILRNKQVDITSE